MIQQEYQTSEPLSLSYHMCDYYCLCVHISITQLFHLYSLTLRYGSFKLAFSLNFFLLSLSLSLLFCFFAIHLFSCSIIIIIYRNVISTSSNWIWKIVKRDKYTYPQIAYGFQLQLSSNFIYVENGQHMS